MKKIIAITLAALVTVFVTCCDLKINAARTEASEKVIKKTYAEEKSSNNTADYPEEDRTKTISIPDMEMITLVDNDECAIILEGVDTDGRCGPALNLQFVNKTDETDMFFNVSANVNGINVPAFLFQEVLAGKTHNTKLKLYLDTYRKYGLDSITLIELDFMVVETDVFPENGPIFADTVKIYPYGEAEATPFVIKESFIKEVFVDNKYIKLSALDYYQDDDWGFCIDFLVENKCGKDIVVDYTDTFVNNIRLIDFVYESLKKNEVSVFTLRWLPDEFRESQLKDIKEIDIALTVFDSKNYGKEYCTERFTISDID